MKPSTLGCTATLVSSRHVIFSAHCVECQTGICQPEDIGTIQLGVHNHKTHGQVDAPTNLPHKEVGISKIIVPPEYEGIEHQTYLLLFDKVNLFI